jgi:hypothetical protein
MGGEEEKEALTPSKWEPRDVTPSGTPVSYISSDEPPPEALMNGNLILAGTLRRQRASTWWPARSATPGAPTARPAPSRSDATARARSGCWPASLATTSPAAAGSGSEMRWRPTSRRATARFGPKAGRLFLHLVDLAAADAQRPPGQVGRVWTLDRGQVSDHTPG